MYILTVDRFDQFQTLSITRMRKLVRYIMELINRRIIIDKLGITYEQFPLLMISIHCEGFTMQQIARITNQHKSGILRGLRGLEIRGLIRFKSDPGVLRKRLVYSTQKAKELSENVMNEAKIFERELFSAISADELRVFSEVLEKLTEKCIDSGATRIPQFSTPEK